MGPRCKLLVEGLGKIERAEVEIRPLMLFVGENNSGKSYLATLMWGLLAMHDRLTPNPETEAFKACDRWLGALLEQVGEERVVRTLTPDDQGSFLRLFNESLSQLKSSLLANAFNDASVEAAVLQISASGALSAIEIRKFVSGGIDHVGLSLGARSPQEWIFTSDAHARMISHLSAYVALGEFAWRRVSLGSHFPIFLPASRTGFMLLYKTVVLHQLDQLSKVRAASDPRPDLTGPAGEFLKLLSLGMKSTTGPYAGEAAFLEEPLRGRVELSTGIGVNEYHFRPAGLDARLTMALSSSLVTELAPIILVLRHMQELPVLILEEPEAHLHPKMQRRLARTIVRLIRKGIYVWITTHSENLCQQINSFLKIGNSPKRADLQRRLGYEEQEYLTSDDVSGYQFTLEGDKSTVTELKKKQSGLVMPTFNHELTALTKEALFLQRETTGEE